VIVGPAQDAALHHASGAESGRALPRWLESLTSALGQRDRLANVAALRPALGDRARQAAVLILIGDGARGPEMMFVERAATLRTHAGQIAFQAAPETPKTSILPTPRSARRLKRPGWIGPESRSSAGCRPCT
jgi:hypothetical protein